MAHNISQDPTKFDASERIYIERPGHLCLVSAGGNINAYLELWDANSRTLAFVNLTTGALVGAIQLAVTNVAQSAAWMAQQAGFGGVSPAPLNAITCLGFPNNVVGGMLYLDSAASSGLVYNFAGTADGSVGAGNGIAVGSAGPVFFGPRILQPGGTLQFGGFLQ